MMGTERNEPAAQERVVAMRAVWSTLDAAAGPLCTLVTLAALLRTLNPSDYGILVIALAASGLSTAINPAIAATTTKFVSELAAGSPVRRRPIAGMITGSLLAVAAIDLVLLIGAALFNEQLSRWLFGASGTSAHMGLVLLLSVLAVSIQQIETVLAAAIRGLERFRRQALIELVSRTLLAAVVTYVAWQTRSLVSILIAQCAVYLASMLARGFMLRQLLPRRRLFELSTPTQVVAMFRYGGWMWLTALAGVAYTNIDRIILGRSLGTAAAGQYNVFVQITQLIHFIPSSVFAFSFPAFSRLAAEGDFHRSRVAHAYKTYLLAICGLAVCITAAMMASWPVLIRILVGTLSASEAFGAPSLLMLNFLLLACNIAPYYLLLALGRARQVSLITTVSMGIALIMMLILIPRFGMQGAALARLAYGLGALLLLWRSRQVLKQTW
jgi:O-antigen/teichoic acid export membrane protein